MFDEEIDREYIVSQDGTSEGTQEKYFKDGFWYKLDKNGSEGLVEYLVSGLLSFSDLLPDEYVVYETGTINGRSGCRSRNFLKSGEELITFYRLYFNEYGANLSQYISNINSMEDRIEYVVRFIKDSCGLDIIPYLKKAVTLDSIVLNEDRHFNNLALIYDGDGFRPAPIFDNGISLLTANQSKSRYVSIAENVRRVTAKPFSGSFKKMHDYFGDGFTVDIEKTLDWLRHEPPSEEKDVLEFQLKKMAPSQF